MQAGDAHLLFLGFKLDYHSVSPILVRGGGSAMVKDSSGVQSFGFWAM